MNGAENFVEGQRWAGKAAASYGISHDKTMQAAAIGLLHATLALAAAAVLPHLDHMWIADRRAWETACSANPDEEE